MSVKYVGKPSPWHGKALFEILVNLRDFGIGRMVVRSNFERYKEPTYYIIKKVEPQMDIVSSNLIDFVTTLIVIS